MEQNLTLEKEISVGGKLLMLDNATPHVAVPVQAISDGEVMATVLSDERGQYQFTNLEPGRYQLRCHVLGGYVYYGEGGSTVTDESGAVFLQVKAGLTRDNIDFRFAPFKKGTWKTYDTLDGLARDAVIDIYRDPDGVMWFATETGGISRYDGKTFANFTTEDGLVNNHVMSVCGGPGGVVWFATGGGVSRYDGKEFLNITRQDGLAGNIILSIHSDPDGIMWFGTRDGLSRYDGRGMGDCPHFTNFTIQDGLAGNAIRSICRCPDGVMWFAVGGGISRYDGKEFTSFTTEDGLVDNNVWCVHRDPDGVMWFGTRGGISRYDGERFVNFTVEDGLVDNYVLAVHCDPDSVVWFGTRGGGVSRYDGKTFVNFLTQDGLASNWVNAIYRDPGGVMWFATEDGGVSRYDSEVFTDLTVQDGLAGSVVRSIYRDPDGVMWFGTTEGISRYDGREFLNLTTQDGLVGKDVWCIHGDLDERMWFATGDGVSCYDGREFLNLTKEDGLADNLVQSMDCGPDGVMWFGTGGGASRYDGKEFLNLTTEDGLTGEVVRSVHCDSDGTIWFGLLGLEARGVSRYDGEALVSFTDEDGLAGSDWVNAIYKGPDGILWFGTWSGVSRYDGVEFVNFAARDGLTHDYVLAIYCDSDGNMWFGTSGGVSCYDGTVWTSLDTRDGLAGNDVAAIYQDADGCLWFATEGGITRYRKSNSPPKVYIASITGDQMYRDLSAVPAFTPGTRVTIEYNSTDFKTFPEKRQYRCCIYETGDMRQETSDSRLRTPDVKSGSHVSSLRSDVSYNPPTKATIFDWMPKKPGIYVFQVQAIDRDLNYSEPASVKLEVIPDPRDLKVSELESDLKARNQQLAFLQQEVERKYHFENIIGDSEAMEWVRAMMDRAIDSGLNVLITGDTGTGKELVAKGIHYNSSRKDKPLITFNCGAIQKELVASELFGHRKGAFTGAIEDKMGLFEVAQGGTVALDEMGDMPLDVQANLLRVLEERKVQRIGEYTLRDVDVRVIAMTNRDLLEEVDQGRFREDLYYRLNGFHIYIPPLRQRTDDIPLLAEHFYQEACRDQDKELGGFAPDVMGMLTSYPWPGNIRELRNEIHRACVLAGDGSRVQVYHFSTQITRGESLIQEVLSEQLGLSASLKRLQRRMIEDALSETGGNRTQAAKLLDMDTANLRKLIRRLGIEA